MAATQTLKIVLWKCWYLCYFVLQGRRLKKSLGMMIKAAKEFVAYKKQIVQNS